LEFDLWINSALQRIYSDNDWDKILHTRLLNILPQESGTTMVATQDSLALALVGPEAFLQKYVDDEWQFVIGAETSQTFQIASFTSAISATLRDGDEWILATASGLTWSVFQNKYLLPDTAKNVVRVQDMANRNELSYLVPQEFDFSVSEDPTHRQNPAYYTLREGRIEIYPHPGDTRMKLGLTYRKGPPVILPTDADADVIPWDREWRDILYKALMVEAAVTQGKRAPIPYELAVAAYEDRLRKLRGLDMNKSDMTGPMGLTFPQRFQRYPTARYDSTPILDV
jgi:hypothetical protein